MVLKRIGRRVSGGIDWFLRILDGEGVALVQVIAYLHIIAAGGYGLFIGGVPSAVAEAMGPVANSAWLWGCSGATVCLVGKLVMRGKCAYNGMILQLAGDLAVLCVLTAYVVAVFQTDWFGRGQFAIWLVMAVDECTLLMVIRDIRRIVQVEQRARRASR